MPLAGHQTRYISPRADLLAR